MVSTWLFINLKYIAIYELKMMLYTWFVKFTGILQIAPPAVGMQYMQQGQMIQGSMPMPQYNGGNKSVLEHFFELNWIYFISAQKKFFFLHYWNSVTQKY